MKQSLPESADVQPIKILGVTVHALYISQLNALITEAVTRNQRWVIAHQNLHSIYVYHHDSKMRAFYAKADYIHIDGMALVFLGRLLGVPLKREQRVIAVCI